MVRATEKNSSARIAAAARRLLESDGSDRPGDTCSNTLFVVNRTDDAHLDRCSSEAALDAGLSMVSLRFGREKGTMPRRANIAFADEGARVEVRDCVLWTGSDDGPVVLVPWDARDDRHFAVGPGGLERRQGRPAAMLGRGMSLAKARLESLARDLRREELGKTVTIVEASDAA